MSQRVGNRIVRIWAMGVLTAAGVVASSATTPLVGATQTPKRQISCSWPVSSGQIDAALGVSVTNAKPMQMTEPVPGGTASWTMCAYFADGGTKTGAIGDVVIEYFSGVGTQQVFTAIERGFAKSKHIQHVTAVPGIGSEAFYAVASQQTYLFAHVGTTMFIVFALRPTSKVIGLGRIIARAL